MFRQIALGLAAATMVGCSSSGSFDIGSKEDVARYATFAAAAKAPTTAPATDVQIAALISGPQLHIYNFTNRMIENASVWINGEYVTQVPIIPSMAEQSVDFSHFYNSAGLVLNTDKTPVKTVTVESGNGVHALLGPLIQQ